jgi:hypothetical protein
MAPENLEPRDDEPGSDHHVERFEGWLLSGRQPVLIEARSMSSGSQHYSNATEDEIFSAQMARDRQILD